MTDSRVEPAAAVGFDRAAAAYDRHRPGYPTDLVARMAEAIGAGSGRRVLDLAAGTGKLTRMLAALGADVVAVEPLAAMRAQLVQSTPGIEVYDGTAEAIPLPDASVDAVTVAQAFHWFDVPKALNEIARVLRPGGGLGLVWNERSPGGWIDGFQALADRLAGGRATYRGDAWQATLDADPRFGPRHREQVTVEERTTPEWMIESMATRSWVASLPGDERAALLTELRAYLASHPDTAGRAEIEHTHPCVVHWCLRIA